MRPRIPLVLFALAVVVAACSGDTAAPSADPGPPDTTAGSVAGAAEPETAAGDSADGDAGEQDSPPLVTVPQIEGDDDVVRNSAFWDMTDDDFPEPLVDPDLIRPGGPPPDGIPPIDVPRFEVADTIDWLADAEPVVVLAVGDERRAYPVQVLTWHEIVNDTIGDTPVTVAYCPLCNSALAYDRRLGDRILDFGTSGMLLHSSLVMYDRQTESLWSHFTAEAVIGELAGNELATLPVEMQSWATFRDANPDGLVLTRDTGYSRDYGRNPYVGYDDPDGDPFLFDGELDDRLAAQTRVVVIRADDDAAAIPLDVLAAAGSLTVEVGGRSLDVSHVDGMASALETERIADGRDVGATRVVDESGTPVEHLDTFWFAIAAFDPDVRIVTG
ncbi:MAG: DUF3179 domain-containing protein [Acidimicrobiales bacterium]